MEQKGRNFVPLVNCKPDEPFQLELRYTVPGNGSRLVYPDFPDPAPAVQEVDLAVYLPQEWVLLGKNGPWTDQFGATWWEQLGLVNDNKASPQIDPRAREREFLAAFQSAGLDDFPVDGRLYLFSSLQPPRSQDGALSLTTMRENWLNATIFVLVILGGALLLPAHGGTRALAVGVLLIALVLCGVFWPIFARQILGGTLAAAFFVVLVVWTVFFGRSLARQFPGSGQQSTVGGQQGAASGEPPQAAVTPPVPPPGTWLDALEKPERSGPEADKDAPQSGEGGASNG